MSSLDLAKMALHRRSELEARINVLYHKCEHAETCLRKLKMQAQDLLQGLNCDPVELKDKFLKSMQQLEEYIYVVTDMNMLLQTSDVIQTEAPPVHDVSNSAPIYSMSPPPHLIDVLSETHPSTSTGNPSAYNYCVPHTQVNVRKDDPLIQFSSVSCSQESVPVEPKCYEVPIENMQSLKIEDDDVPDHSPSDHNSIVSSHSDEVDAKQEVFDVEIPAQTLLEMDVLYNGVIMHVDGAQLWIITEDISVAHDLMRDMRDYYAARRPIALTREQLDSLRYCVYEDENECPYRCFIIHIEQQDDTGGPGMAELFLVDTGEQRCVECEALLPLEPRFSDHPPLARCCNLAGIIINDSNQNENMLKVESYLRKYIGTSLEIFVDDNSSECLEVYIALPQKVLLNKLLIEEGLAVPVEPATRQRETTPPVAKTPTTASNNYPTTAADTYPTTAPKNYPTTTSNATYPTTATNTAYPLSMPNNTYPTTMSSNTYPPAIPNNTYRTTMSNVTYPAAMPNATYPTTVPNNATVHNFPTPPPGHPNRMLNFQFLPPGLFNHSGGQFMNPGMLAQRPMMPNLQFHPPTSLPTHTSINALHPPLMLMQNTPYMPQPTPPVFDSYKIEDCPEYEDPLEAAVGYHSRDEIDLCKHYKGGPDKSCFKGARCKKRHVLRHPDGYTLDRVPVLAKCAQLPLPQPGSYHEVRVTYICSCEYIYVQFVTPPEEKKPREFGVIMPPMSLESMVQDMNSAAGRSAHRALKMAPAVGELVAAVYPPDGQWYRAVVLGAQQDEQSIEVRYVDYGNVMWIRENQVRELDPAYSLMPIQAVQCRLTRVRVTDTQPEQLARAKNALQSLVLDKIVNALIIARGLDQLELEIYDQSGQSIADKLEEMGLVQLQPYTIQDDTDNEPKIIPA